MLFAFTLNEISIIWSSHSNLSLLYKNAEENREPQWRGQLDIQNAYQKFKNTEMLHDFYAACGCKHWNSTMMALVQLSQYKT